MSNHRGYSDAEMETIASMLRNGASAAEIARELPGDRTRNAIIGVVHRNKTLAEIGFQRGAARNQRLKPKPPRGALPRARRSAQTPKLTPSALSRREPFLRREPLPVEPVPTDAPPARMMQLHELTEATCKWPLGHPGTEDFGFCGVAKPVGVGPYCAYHAALSRAVR